MHRQQGCARDAPSPAAALGDSPRALRRRQQRVRQLPAPLSLSSCHMEAAKPLAAAARPQESPRAWWRRRVQPLPPPPPAASAAASAAT
jgi:hypothetical protein